ncbi:MAG: hypothetical protein PUI24_03770 [Spirochaetales bacterium]|nr:hypothetical protein [Spirochaetales bacterium]
MKNLTSKKKSFAGTVLLFLFTACPSLFAQNDYDFKLSVMPYTGILNTSIKEVLYYDGNFGSDKNEKCSELVWEIKNEFLAGIDFSADYRHFNFFASGDFLVPVECGKMYDSDWNTQNVKVSYSINEIHILNGARFKTGMGYYFVPKKNAAVKPVVFFDYAYYSLKACNGYGWYGNSSWTTDGKEHAWYDEEAHFFPDGKYKLASVFYTSHGISLFTGCDFLFNVSEKVNAFFGMYIAPVSFLYAKDFHSGNNSNTWEDYVLNICRNFGFEAKAEYNFTKHLTGVFSAKGNIFLLTKGYDYLNGYISEQKCAAGCEDLSVTLGVKLNIF